MIDIDKYLPRIAGEVVTIIEPQDNGKERVTTLKVTKGTIFMNTFDRRAKKNAPAHGTVTYSGVPPMIRRLP